MEYDAAHWGDDTDCPLLSVLGNSITPSPGAQQPILLQSQHFELDALPPTHSGPGLALWDSFGFISWSVETKQASAECLSE